MMLFIYEAGVAAQPCCPLPIAAPQPTSMAGHRCGCFLPRAIEIALYIYGGHLRYVFINSYNNTASNTPLGADWSTCRATHTHGSAAQPCGAPKCGTRCCCLGLAGCQAPPPHARIAQVTQPGLQLEALRALFGALASWPPLDQRCDAPQPIRFQLQKGRSQSLRQQGSAARQSASAKCAKLLPWQYVCSNALLCLVPRLY